MTIYWSTARYRNILVETISGKYVEGNNHDRNHSKTTGTFGRNVPQARLSITFGPLPEQQKCSEHGRVRALGSPVR